jgi:preprotein translocase subunit SecG
VLHNILLIFLLVASVGLVAVVLLQSGRSAGLSGAIAGGAESLFGKKKGLDAFLSKLTTGFAIGFMLSALLLTIIGA